MLYHPHNNNIHTAIKNLSKRSQSAHYFPTAITFLYLTFYITHNSAPSGNPFEPGQRRKKRVMVTLDCGNGYRGSKYCIAVKKILNGLYCGSSFSDITKKVYFWIVLSCVKGCVRGSA